MKKNVVLGLMLAVFMGMLQPCAAAAQDDKGKSTSSQDNWNFYKLDFVVKELEDGKTVNTRNYSLVARSNDWVRLRVGNRVPIATKDTNVTYQDLGFNLDCRVEERGDQPSISTRAEISSVAAPEQADARMTAPIVRRVQMDTYAPLGLGKGQVLASADELNSKHRFQLEVTATKVGK